MKFVILLYSGFICLKIAMYWNKEILFSILLLPIGIVSTLGQSAMSGSEEIDHALNNMTPVLLRTSSDTEIPRYVWANSLYSVSSNSGIQEGTHDGVLAAQSGTVSNAQMSTMQCMVCGPAIVTYGWKVNCNALLSALAFAVDDTNQNSISGDIDWQKYTNLVADGSHVLNWTLYLLYSAMTSGTGWLNQINIKMTGDAPSIISQPNDITLTAGNSLTLSTSAIGTAPLYFQWQLNGINISGATNTSLSFSDVQAENSGIYTVTITNQFGSVTSLNATVTVTPTAPLLVRSPFSQSINVRGAFALKSVAIGTEPMSVQWFQNDLPVAFATNSTLPITNAQYAQSGNYYAVFSNALGMATSSVAQVEVAATVAVQYSIAGTPPIGLLGATNLVAVAAGGSLTVGLRKDGTVVAWSQGSVTNVPENLTNVVAIAAGFDHGVALKADGTVAVWGKNTYGQRDIPEGLSNVVSISAADNFTLALQEDGNIVAWGHSHNGFKVASISLTNVDSILAGAVDNFAVMQDGTLVRWENSATGGVSVIDWNFTNQIESVDSIACCYRWGWILQDDGMVMNSDQKALPAKSESILKIQSSQLLVSFKFVLTLSSDGTFNWEDLRKSYTIPNEPVGIFDISVMGNYFVMLQGDGSPRVVTGRRVRSAKSGDKISISSRIAGTFPMAYQWSHDGVLLKDATNCFLAIPSVSPADGGVYSCVGSNEFGLVTNQACTLKVANLTPSLQMTANREDGTVDMRIRLVNGSEEVVVYSSEDLVSWIPIWTNTPMTTETHLIESVKQGTRFYRVKVK